MPIRSDSLSPTTRDKLAELADLLSQASHIAREISQTQPKFHLNQSILNAPSPIPQDQAWFWTPEWQAAEREVDEEFARGNYAEFDSAEALIADLHKHV